MTRISGIIVIGVEDAIEVVRRLRRPAPEPAANSEAGRVLAALRLVDAAVTSLYDYVNGPTSPAAVPVLLRLLDEVKDPHLVEGIVRGLTVRGAGPEVALALVRTFERRDQPDYVRWAVGNALLEVRDASTATDIVRLLRQAEYGASRQKLAIALGFLRTTDGATEALISVLPDRSVMAHAAMAIKRRKDMAALPVLQSLDLTGATTWQTRQVEAAIETLTALAR